jgi:uncharacterized membrane protein YwaF
MLLATIPVFVLAAYFIFRRRSQRAKDAFVWSCIGVNIASTVAAFAVEMATEPEMRDVWLSRLPLQLCSSNVFLYAIVFALRRGKFKTLAFAYAYFVGSPGAFLGALMPPAEYIGVSLFRLDESVYFLRHNMIAALPPLLAALGYYRPKRRDMLSAALILLAMLVPAHIVNLSLSALGGYRVNYFYTFGDSNVILSFFYNNLPIPLVYMIPMIPVLIPVFALWYAPFYAKDLLRKRGGGSESCGSFIL